MLSGNFLRRTSALVLLTFTSLTMQPLQAAMQLPKVERAKPAALGPDEKYSRLLADIHELLKQLAPTVAMPAAVTGKQKDVRAVGPNMKIVVEETIKPMPGVNVAAKLKELRTKLKEVGDYSKAAEASFAEVAQHIKDRKLPAEILSRHEAAVKEYETRKTEFESLAQAVIDTGDAKLPGALNALAAFFAKYPNEKTHTPTDPNKLPWRTPDGKVRKPFESAKEFKTSLFKEPRVNLAGPIPWGLTLPSTTLPATPVADDLAQTEDVQITPAIQALADSLGKNPVKIYNWVRNTIEFLPTYGSIQGADMTLQTKRGNAFDTASLLIGLLRASNIPARYVYGTVEVPMDKTMNWVGGVTKPEAALSLLGQGGIPNIGVVSGGAFKSVKLEHVWVEAWVDYVPSRGAVNKVGDTWVKMDASFKQYTYTQGMDIAHHAPPALDTLFPQPQLGASTNQTEGSVQYFDATAFQTALANYQNQVKTYIDTTKPNATVGDVLGRKTIQPQNHSILHGTLPYKTIALGGKFNVLPDMVRHQLQYNLYASNYDVALDNPFLNFKQSLPRLAGKKITLSFAPASQADADLIASYLPKPHTDGSPIQPSEFPKALPGYLIHLTAELRVDGQVIVSGGNFAMGTELASNIGLLDPVNGWDFGDTNHPVAGEYISTIVDGAGIPLTTIQATQSRLAATQANLTSGQYGSINKDDIVGEVLHATIASYFTATYGASVVAAQAANMIEYRKPSFGSAFISAQPAYWYGIAKQVSFPTVALDVDHYVTMIASQDNSSDLRKTYLRYAGHVLSAYEHIIPEQVFADTSTSTPAEGVSAVKALSIANAQGQKIFRITGQNLAIALPQLTISPDIKLEIENAVLAGKEVTVAAANVTVGGWTGAGYIIEDPTTGVGAYKISGGTNGGSLTLPAMMLAFLAVAAVFFIATPLLAIVAGVAAFAAHILMVLSLMDDPHGMADYAIARFLTLIGTLVLIIILDGIVFFSFPLLFLLSILFAAISAVIAIVKVFLSTTALLDRKNRGSTTWA